MPIKVYTVYKVQTSCGELRLQLGGRESHRLHANGLHVIIFKHIMVAVFK